MRPVAQSGGRNSILFETTPNRGRVLVRDEGVLYPELNIYGIIAHGYWDEFTGDADEALAEAGRASEFEPPRRRLRAHARGSEGDVLHVESVSRDLVRVKRAAEQSAAARAELVQAIRDAKENHTVREIGTAAGLSYGRISQILRGK